MKNRKFGLSILFVLLMLTCSIQLAFAEVSADRALLIQGDLPWGSNANTVLLDQLVSTGHYAGYDVKTASEVSDENYNLSGYKIVIFANDQSQTSYDQYSDILKNKLESYANLGGVVIFGICDMGWNSGTLSATLPGGITKTNIYQSTNYIVDSTNPVVTGELSDDNALADSDLVGNYCSHASFVESSLPEGTIVILRGSDDNLPTLVDYPYGSGHIIASGLTWEIGYKYGWSFATKAYDDLLIYALEVANNVGELADLTAYNEALGKVTESEYTEESWAEYQSIVEANEVTETNTQTEVDTATSKITEAQGSLITKVEALALAKEAAIKELNDYKESADYSEANWVLISNIKSSGVETINESTSPSAITTTLLEVKAEINAVKTIAQEEAEVLAEALEKAKIEAKDNLNNDLATYTSTDYTEENWTILLNAKTDGDEAIDVATTLLEVETAKAKAIAEMDAVKTIEESVNTYKVTGYVIEEGTDNSYVEGATVKIMIGNRQIEKTITDSNGIFNISYVSNGIYNLVISKDEQTVTQIINVLNNDVSTGPVHLPNGRKNSIVDVKNDNLDIAVGNLNDFFNSNQFTEDDENVVNDGGTVEIKLTIEEKPENDAENAVEIKALAGSTKTIGMYLDLNLNKIVTTNSAIATTGSAINTTGSAISGTYAIKELQDVLVINIPLPTELQGKSGYVIYRYHGTEVQKITKAKNSDGEYIVVSTDGKSITLYAKKFSTYAIAYSSANNNNNDDDDTVIETDSNTGGEIKINNNNKSATITPYVGYVIADVLVDGKSIGATSTYTFNDAKSHKISAVFIEDSALPYYMQDGKKVFIGFAAILDDLLKYIIPDGKKVQFAENRKSFTDIENHWAKDNIDYVTEREILVGIENSKFSPNTGITRAMFVTVIGRLYERSYGNIIGNTTFLDVDTNAYYAKYVAWAYENNIINGIGENKFSPDTDITREQMSEIMFKFAKLLDKAPIGDWLINVNYSDKSEISDWAIDSVAYCQLANIIIGRDNNEFAPNDTVTRAEVAAVIERFIKEMLK